MPNAPFRILLLGDDKVGKTSLIKSYVSKSFPQEVPAVSPIVVIPAELSESKTTVTIVDSLYRRDQEKDETMEIEMRKTDVILLLYDISRLYTLVRITSFWLPWISKVTKAPIILVGNKMDMRSAGVGTSEEILQSVVRDFPQCVFATECEVLTLANTDAVFYYAHLAALYPSAPLYDPIRHELTPQFKRALLLCFRRLDRDKDKVLSDRELNDLQTQVFNQRFKDAELESLKDLIKAECPEGVSASGITFAGFVALQRLLIKKLHGNICWALLRYFGFNDNLYLETSLQLDMQSNQSVELSNDTVDFLVSLFEVYAVDGKMSVAALRDVFGTVETPLWAVGDETGEAWQRAAEHVQTDEQGALLLASWLALWHMYAFLDYKTTYHYLVMVGLDLPKTNVFLVTRPKDVTKTNKRKAFLCQLYGDDGVGKNSLMASFISRMEDTQLDTVCAPVEGDRRINESHYLILQARVETSQNPACDISCLIHDGSQTSIDFLREEVISKLPEMLPKLIIRTKADEGEEESGDFSFAIDMGLTEFPAISLKRNRPDLLFKQIVDIAISPIKGLGRAAKEQIKAEQYQHQISYSSWFLTSMAAAALIGVGLLVKKG